LCIIKAPFLKARFRQDRRTFCVNWEQDIILQDLDLHGRFRSTLSRFVTGVFTQTLVNYVKHLLGTIRWT